jgi:hypothetical protein
MDFENKKVGLPSKWMRICARSIDYALFYLIGRSISFFLPINIEDFFDLYLILIVPLCWAPLEAVLLWLWGTTLGKKIFGISVRDLKGEKLSYLLAFKRSCLWSAKGSQLILSTTAKGRSLLGGIVLTLCAGGVFCNNLPFSVERLPPDSQWIQYFSAEKGFSINLPKDPEGESKKLALPTVKDTLDYKEYKSCGENICYTIGHVDLPRAWKWAGSSKLLKGALQVVLKNQPEALLIHSEPTRHQKYPALDFHLKEGESEIQGRLILIGTSLYKLTMKYPPSLTQDLQKESFIGSFEPRAKNTR